MGQRRAESRRLGTGLDFRMKLGLRGLSHLDIGRSLVVVEIVGIELIFRKGTKVIVLRLARLSKFCVYGAAETSLVQMSIASGRVS